MIHFKESHFEKEIIMWGVRWYVAYPISCRQLEEMKERGGVGRSRHRARDAAETFPRKAIHTRNFQRKS